MLRRNHELETYCPCSEGLAAPAGGQILCAKHAEQVLRHVRRRFGSHRFGGRYAHYVEDIVHECYVNLLAPGGLDSFDPDPGRPRADAFGAWLWGVLRNQCHNKLNYLSHHPSGEPLEMAAEPTHGMTPEQAFAQTFLTDLLKAAVAKVEACWKAKGAKKGERFEVFLPFVFEENVTYEQAQLLLGISNVHAKKLKHDLSEDVLQALRRLVRDTLYLEPGLGHDAIERRIDAEIEALIVAAYPPRSIELLPEVKETNSVPPNSVLDGEELER